MLGSQERLRGEAGWTELGKEGGSRTMEILECYFGQCALNLRQFGVPLKLNILDLRENIINI